MASVLLVALIPLLIIDLLAANAIAQNEPTLLAEDFLSADRTLKCQRLKNRYGKMCSSFGYNMTLMPNLLNHQKQREAFAHYQGYSALIASGCSAELPFLLCAYHFPMCSVEADRSLAPALITPCRGLCERVRDDCLPTMRSHGFQWPEQMRCEKLQISPLMRTMEGDRVACVDRPRHETVTMAPTCPPISCDHIKLKKKAFTKGLFHFALEATYLGGFLLHDRKELQVRVAALHHICSAVPADHSAIKVGSMITLRTEQTDLCSCPDLEKGATYLFTGYIDKRGRLRVESHKSLMLSLTNASKQSRRVNKYMKKFCARYRPYSVNDVVRELNET